MKPFITLTPKEPLRNLSIADATAHAKAHPLRIDPDAILAIESVVDPARARSERGSVSARVYIHGASWLVMETPDDVEALRCWPAIGDVTVPE